MITSLCRSQHIIPFLGFLINSPFPIWIWEHKFSAHIWILQVIPSKEWFSFLEIDPITIPMRDGDWQITSVQVWKFHSNPRIFGGN